MSQNCRTLERYRVAALCGPATGCSNVVERALSLNTLGRAQSELIGVALQPDPQ